MAANPEQSEIFAQIVKRQIARVLESMPHMESYAQAHRRNDGRVIPEGGQITDPQYNGIRTHGGSRKSFGHGDPTGNGALEPNRAADWLREAQRLFALLAQLDDRIVPLIGPPVQICPGCIRPILEDERTDSKGGKRWHHRCVVRFSRQKT